MTGGDGERPHPGRSSINLALAWVDAATRRLGSEDTPLRDAVGRVLASDVRSSHPIPPRDCAALDGFAVEAHQTFGAGAYNPLSLPLFGVAAGDPLPGGTDAVVPLEHGEVERTDRICVVEAVASGDNVHRQGTVAAAGALLASAGSVVATRHIGILAAAGFAQLPVVRRPHVLIVITGSIAWGAPGDSNGPLLCALVERDGGVVLERAALDRTQPRLVELLGAGAADVTLVAGGTGTGRNDAAAAALAAAGELAIYGLALRPGETAGFGRTGAGMPVILLPGSPAACLWSYELFAGRAIRRLGGHGVGLPYRSRMMTTTRKIVSAIGMTEICPVRCGVEGGVEPMASFAEIGLMGAAGADGFVSVPETCEGYPPGTPVNVYLYDDR